jgi:hypothetical protein
MSQGPRAEKFRTEEVSHGRVSDRHARLVVISPDVIFAETATVQGVSNFRLNGSTPAAQGTNGGEKLPLWQVEEN